MNTLESQYLLIAYKPNSNDYCRGCHMASYSSDFIHYESDNFDHIVQKLAECYAFETDCGEAGYEEIHVYGPSDEKVAEVYSAARLRSEEIAAERKRLAEVAAAKKRTEDAEKEKARRLAEFERLKKEFGNE